MDSNNEDKICLLHGNAARFGVEYSPYWGGIGKDSLITCFAKQVSLVNAEVKTFKDGEVSVLIKENIRQDVFIIQSFYTGYQEYQDSGVSSKRSVNDHLMELLSWWMHANGPLLDPLRLSSRISDMPDKTQDQKGADIARLVADMLTVSGVSRVLTMDLHAGQLQGFFNVPVDNLYGAVVVAKYIRKLTEEEKKNLVLCRLTLEEHNVPEILGPRGLIPEIELAIIDKVREKPTKVK